MMGKLGQMMGMGTCRMPSPEQIEALQKQAGGARAPACAGRARHSFRAAARRVQPSAAVPRSRPGGLPKLPGLGGVQSVRREEEVNPRSREREKRQPSI